MDQIVFVFDLEQVVPLEQIVGGQEDSLIEASLNNVRQAALRIATFCSDAGKIAESRRDLPSLGFRFYSSTEYFSVPPQLTGEWHDLSLSSWETMEDSLVDRVDSIMAALQRTEAGQSLTGHKAPSAALCKVLEEVSALYSWDRPALHSPVKKGRKAEQKLGNAVVVVTKLPEDVAELDSFLGAGTRKKKPTVREIVDSFISKRVKSQLSSELNISIHILDTGEETGVERGEVAQLFNRALKEFRGGVLPISSMGTLLGTKVDMDSQCSTLVCTSRSVQRVPSSAVVQAHLAEVVIPSKVLDKSYGLGEVRVGKEVMGFEFKKSGVKLAELESRGFIRNTFFKVGQWWKESFSVWSDVTPAFGAILLYLKHTGQCLLMENKDNIMAVMFYQTETSATFCIMDKVESNFYHMLLSLDSHTPTIMLTEEVDALLKDIKSVQFSPSKKPVFIPKPVTAQFDVSVLENWRLPDIPTPKVMTSLKEATASLTNQNSSYHKLMLGLRESYTSRGVMKGEKMKSDRETKSVPNSGKVDVAAGKLEKKLSTMSTGSTVSLGSNGAKEITKSKGGRLNLSRGEVLRQLGERNRNSVTDAGDGKEEHLDSATFVKETVQGAKARAATDLMQKMGNPSQETDDLIDNLAALKNSVVTGADDLVLAGYAEACVSVLLKHLDTVGVCKTSLEEVVTNKLLLDVSTVAKLYCADPKLRVAQHKVQVLLRAEVHWLLANQTKQEQYEDSMLTHIRQISLHGGNNVMTEFLSMVLTECYVDRQPELLSVLYDELDQERPRQLAMLFSPTGSQPPSAGPSSNYGSAAPGSHGVMAPPPVFTKPASNKSNNLARKFMSRPKSFDTSLTRQINIGAGRRERKNLKVVTTGRMITKSKLSAKKKKTNLSHKSPRKTKQMVKRNLTFDDGRHRSPILPLKSPRKNLSVTTPSKVRKFTPHKSKLTPGKQHRVLCPETPNHRDIRRKSDGNTSIAETPDKGDRARTIASPRRQQASLALRRKASFYSGGGSRNVQKFEDSFNASLITGNISSMEMNSSSLDMSSTRRDSAGSLEQATNRSFMLFPHLLNKKRKREDSLGGAESQGLNSSMAEFQAKYKVPKMDTKSPVKKVKRRLNSFSDNSDSSSFPAACNPSSSLETVTSQTSLKPLESTCLSGTAHVGHHLAGPELDLSGIPIGNKTPKKGQKTPMKIFQQDEDFFSPGKRVMFNMAPQPPTPKLGMAAKSILKTPLKTSNSPARTAQSPFLTPSRQNLHFKTPVKTPSKVAMKLSLTPKREISSRESTILIPRTLTPKKSLHTTPLKSPHNLPSVPSPLTTHCSSRVTPGKSPARRDIGLSSGRAIFFSKEELVKTPTKSLPNSPIIKPTKPRVEASNVVLSSKSEQEFESRERNPSNASSCENHGFPTPSPSARAKKEALNKVTNLLNNEVEYPQLFRGPSSEQQFHPPMMSTLQNPPSVNRTCISLVGLPFPSSEKIFLPTMASTEQDLDTFLPPGANSKVDPVMQATLPYIQRNKTTIQHAPSVQTLLLADTLPWSNIPKTTTLLTTQEIINSSTLVDLSTTIIKPSSEIPANIFDNSALYPPPINSTVTGISSLSPTNLAPNFASILTTPTKKGPIEVHHLKSPDEIAPSEKTPVKYKTPVKSFSQSEQELELVSPVKRVGDNIVRNLESEDEEEEDQTDGVMVSENVVDEIVAENADDIPIQTLSLKFRKTDSEHSLAASSDRTTPEPNPSSGYSSEPQPDPPSPGYTSDHSSPGKVQVSSPPKPSRKSMSRTEKELERLQDKMSGFFSPVGTRRKRKNRLASLKDVDANDEIVNESVHATPPRNVIALHSDSPLADVQDELLPITPEMKMKKNDSMKSCKSEENGVQAKIRLPRELSGLNDLMSPFFSAGEGKRKSALRKQLIQKPTEKKGRAIKRRQSVAGEMLKMSSKKKPRRQSVMPVSYKEKEDSEDSQTDEEELVRMVKNHYENDESDNDVPEDDLPEPNIDCRMTPEKEEPDTKDDKIIDLTSPPRFKCEYCGKKFKNKIKMHQHREEELEEIQAKNTEKRKCPICGSTFKTVQDLALHGRAAGCKPKRLSDVTTLDLQSNQEFNIGKTKESPEASKTPKIVAQLQDKLSGYYSPATNQTRVRKVPERLVEVYNHQVQTTPKSTKVQPKKFFRTKTFLQDAPSTSTPNEVRTIRAFVLKPDLAADTPDNNSSRRRSVREKNISYADFPDFDSSNTEESDITISPEERRKQPKSSVRKKFVLASRRSPVKEFVSPENMVLSPTFSNHSMMTLSPSVAKHFKQRKKRGLLVKNLNESQEIQDVSSALDESQEIHNSPIRTPTKSPKTLVSPGKYFSIAKVTETPTGQIRMKLNRITKPHQPGGTPATSRKPAAAKRTPENRPDFKDLIIPRLNRSACKEMGLSPNKLQEIIAASPVKWSPAKGTPEKENVPSISETCRQVLKMENQVTKTPRIRIKKVPSGEDCSDLVQVWKAETVFSPRKQCSPLKALPNLFTSPSRNFSPLTSGSIHKLTTSPIINTRVSASSRMKKKVNKQLAYL